MKCAAATTLVLILGCSQLVGCNSGARRGDAPNANDLDRRIAYAVRLTEQGDAAKDPAVALEFYERALEQYAELAQAWNGKGVALLALDRYLEAGDAFRRAADLWPDDPRPLFNLGLAYYNRRYFPEAREKFAGAIRRDPNHLPSLRAAVECDRILNNGTPETLEWIKRLLMLDPNPDNREELNLFRLRIQHKLETEAG
nr:hypothetical protein [uncultured bacterium]